MHSGRELRLIGLKLPLIKPGDDLAKLIVEAAKSQVGGLLDGDVVVVTSKVVSKARGYLLDVKRLEREASVKAKILAKLTGKPLWQVEGILRLSRRIVAAVPVYDILRATEFPLKLSRNPKAALKLLKGDRVMLIAELADGRLASEAGIDTSNIPEGMAAYPPPDPDKEARRLREEISKYAGVNVAVIISDTEFSLSRYGSLDIAIGCSGVECVERGMASPDVYGKPKYGGVDLVADELAAAAALLMGQAAEGLPVVIVRGLSKCRGDLPVRECNIPSKVLLRGLILSIIETMLVRLVLRLTSLLS